MARNPLDAAGRSRPLVNVVAMLLMASMSASLLVLLPWGLDPLYSPLSHFLTLFPLVLLAILTYVASVKLDAENEEVP